MKLNTRNLKSTKGMTLLELTVVILVLLSLISILFVGARAWKKGSDRSANIMNIRNVQQAVRGHQNMHQLNYGDPLLPITIVGKKAVLDDPLTTGTNEASPAVEGYIKYPKAPATGLTYAFTTNVVPNVGVLYLTVTGANVADYAPAAGSTSDW